MPNGHHSVVIYNLSIFPALLHHSWHAQCDPEKTDVYFHGNSSPSAYLASVPYAHFPILTMTHTIITHWNKYLFFCTVSFQQKKVASLFFFEYMSLIFQVRSKVGTSVVSPNRKPKTNTSLTTTPHDVVLPHYMLLILCVINSITMYQSGWAKLCCSNKWPPDLAQQSSCPTQDSWRLCCTSSSLWDPDLWKSHCWNMHKLSWQQGSESSESCLSTLISQTEAGHVALPDFKGSREMQCCQAHGRQRTGNR